MTRDRSRDCPGGCGRPVHVGQYACSVCWSTLPPATRRRVNQAWRAIRNASIAGPDPDLDPLGAVLAAPIELLREYMAATDEAAALLSSRMPWSST